VKKKAKTREMSIRDENTKSKGLTPGWVAAILLIVALGLTGTGEAITRGQAVAEIMKALEIPLRTSSGEVIKDIPKGAPYEAAARSAAVYGILPPGEYYYPTLEITKLEAIYLAIRAMGWNHVAQTSKKLIAETNGTFSPSSPFVPYVEIAQRMRPPIPQDLVDQPEENLSAADLSILTQWLRACKQGCAFEKSVDIGFGELKVHRHGTGAPPAMWIIKIKEFPIEATQAAQNLKGKLEAMGYDVLITSDDCALHVAIGPFDSYLKGWRALSALPQEFRGILLPHGGPPAGALFWSALVIDPKVAPSILPAAPFGKRRLPISEIASESGAKAAINGGFFAWDLPIGTLKIDGTLARHSFGERNAAGWDEGGKWHFGPGNVKAWLHLGGTAFPIDCFNEPPSFNGFSIYTPHFGAQALKIPHDAMEGSVREGILRWKTPSVSSQHYIPGDGFLIVGRGRARVFLAGMKLGASAQVATLFGDPAFAETKNIVQAGPLLIHEGKPYYRDERFAPTLTEVKHPRTMLGHDGQRVWWIVIDGRDSWHSQGATLEEARKLAYSLGLKEALNLDGGGSSALWLDGALVNHPPGGEERPLPYALVVP